MISPPQKNNSASQTLLRHCDVENSCMYFQFTPCIILMSFLYKPRSSNEAVPLNTIKTQKKMNRFEICIPSLESLLPQLQILLLRRNQCTQCPCNLFAAALAKTMFPIIVMKTSAKEPACLPYSARLAINTIRPLYEQCTMQRAEHRNLCGWINSMNSAGNNHITQSDKS